MEKPAKINFKIVLKLYYSIISSSKMALIFNELPDTFNAKASLAQFCLYSRNELEIHNQN